VPAGIILCRQAHPADEIHPQRQGDNEILPANATNGLRRGQGGGKDHDTGMDVRPVVDAVEFAGMGT
jgi:hypothetical protein